jgi:hypothetical protein
LLISACSSKEPEVKTQYIEKIPLNLSTPGALSLSPVYYHVVTSENAEKKFLEQTNKNLLPVFICVTPNDYKNIALNINALENRDRASAVIIDEYKKYYEGESNGL